MQLNPLYGSDPVITLDGPPAAVLAPTVRQRRRLQATVSQFSDQDWAQPSRCEGWSNRDVISHLESTNTFWTFSIGAGLAGSPTEFLATFDPVATPAELVAASSSQSPAEVLERFVASNDALIGTLESLGEDDWSTIAEAPPGHQSVSALTHHALWDSWIHERDVLVPLGRTPDEEDDEIATSLRYVAALGPALGLHRGMGRRGTLAIDATDPAVSVRVEIGDRVVVHEADNDADIRLTGGALELLEALSLRRPMEQLVSGPSAWMVHGLARAFDGADDTAER